MGSDNQDEIFFPDDKKFRRFCDICDKLRFDRQYKNHLKSGYHTTNIRNKQRKTNTKKYI